MNTQKRLEAPRRERLSQIPMRGPVAQVIPMEENEPAPLEGSVQYHEDIVAPTGDVWDADG